MDPKPWPTELRLAKDRRRLTVTFDDGAGHVFAAEFLRVHSPSAEVQGHSPEQRKLVTGKADIAITAIDPIGSYAVRLTFSDGHNTGLFTWAYFRELGDKHDELWTAYLGELAEIGLTRS